MVLILSVFESELEPINENMVTFEKKALFEREIKRGLLGRNEIVTCSGIFGKVESAFITQKLIDEHKINNIFLVSGAGALTDELEIGDVVIGEAYHEYDKRLKENEPNPAIIGDLETLSSIKFQFSGLKRGKIISGDQIVTEKSFRNELYDRYRALALDMDSAVMATVAKVNHCKFLSIKVILDKSDEKTSEDFNQYFSDYNTVPAKILCEYLKNHFVSG
ncbi:MAG: 5'-methylthioadenosine/S-adenosylhomocysteine nucleosidase [Thermotogota bacterium]|nr:5'-methylthioadenosine/S-adenosylhomocysteine nucleosidase [Thermotogota bacterium]